jgi:hypothetical protein
MSAGLGLTGALDRVDELGGKVGIDRGSDLDAIRRFADGPVVITVAAESGEHAASVAALAESAGIGATVQRTSLGSVAQPALCDLLIVVTPANRALSLSEESVVRKAHAHGSGVALALVDVGLFGDGPERKQAITEIERLRLGPALTPLAVPWFFLGTDEGDEAFTNALRRARSAGHERAARHVLDAVMHSMLDDLAARLAAHDQEAARLLQAEALLAAVPGRLEHEAGLVRMSLRRSLEAAEQNVYQAGLETPALLAIWLASRGRAEWAPVEEPLRQSWRQCLDLARHIADRSRTRFAGEIARLDPTVQAGLPPSECASLASSWDTGDLREALASLAAVDLERIFGELRAQCEPEPQDDAEGPLQTDAYGEDAPLGDAYGGDGFPGDPSRAGARQVTRSALPAGLRAHLNAQLHFAVATRMRAVVVAASAATAAGARADTAAALTLFAERLAARRAEFDEQARWTTAHAELAGLAGAAPERGARADSGLLPGGGDGR